MIEVIKQLQTILVAETHAGGLIAGAEITINDNALPKANAFVAISAVEEQFENSQGWDYEAVHGFVFITCVVMVENKPADKFEKASAAARVLARGARQTLLSNRQLITDDFPQGIIRCGTDTTITRQVPGFTTQDSAWYAYERLHWESKYIYRQGQLSIT